MTPNEARTYILSLVLPKKLAKSFQVLMAYIGDLQKENERLKGWVSTLKQHQITIESLETYRRSKALEAMPPIIEKQKPLP